MVQKIIDAKKLDTFDDFLSCTDYTCEGVGQITAGKLRKGLNVFENDMRETLKYIQILVPKAPVAGSLGGKSFCFTGAASRPRKELWELVEKNGGIVHETMKKDTSFLVLADPNSTSSKATKARKQGTNLISEEEFIKMCEV
jgi:DNA ligase (NAD+)